MGLLYEEIYEKPIPVTHAPPQNIPAREKLSPGPALWPYALVFIGGLFLGSQLGRAILRTAIGITEAEISRRVTAAGRRRGL